MVVDLFLLSVLGDGLEVSVDVADPSAGVGLALLDDLAGIGGEASLLGEIGLAGRSALLIGLAGSSTDQLGIGIHLVQGLGIVEWIVLLGVVEDTVGLGGADGGLDLVGIDHAGDVGIGDL